jgi:hypothetical protein
MVYIISSSFPPSPVLNLTGSIVTNDTNPKNAATQLNTSATIPFVVNLAGNGLGGKFAFERSEKLCVLLPAFPSKSIYLLRRHRHAKLAGGASTALLDL